MKTFDIITEADARVLQRGETVMLSRRGHITPLALDTLRERRVTVVQEGSAAPDDLRLAPAGRYQDAWPSPATTRASRCAASWSRWLRGRGLAVADHGTDSTEPVDYPDVAAAVARAVSRGEADAGIVIDGAGIGSAIAANKLRGIRAAMATTETIARYSREHNGANVLTLGASLVTAEEARAIVGTWLSTPMREPRYIRRLAKIRDLEQLP